MPICRQNQIHAHYSVEICRYYARQRRSLHHGFGDGYPRYIITPKFRLSLCYQNQNHNRIGHLRASKCTKVLGRPAGRVLRPGPRWESAPPDLLARFRRRAPGKGMGQGVVKGGEGG